MVKQEGFPHILFHSISLSKIFASRMALLIKYITITDPCSLSVIIAHLTPCYLDRFLPMCRAQLLADCVNPGAIKISATQLVTPARAKTHNGLKCSETASDSRSLARDHVCCVSLLIINNVLINLISFLVSPHSLTSAAGQRGGSFLILNQDLNI